MRILALALLASLFLTAASPQSRTKTPKDTKDKIGKSKAPIVVKKAVLTSIKKKMASISEEVITDIDQRESKTKFTGIMKGEFSGVRGTSEIYTLKKSLLVRDSKDRLVAIKKLEVQGAIAALSYRTPLTFLGEVLRLAATAGYGATEKVDGVDCKILYLTADSVLVKQQLKEVSDRVGRALRARAANSKRLFAGSFFSGNLSSLFDLKKTRSAYSIWVGKKDLLIRKIEWTFTTEVKKNALPKDPLNPRGGVQLKTVGVTTDLTFTDWGETQDFKIPREIRAKWGVK